jgi:branched-chain amino acid transport system permease protein
MQSFYYLMLLFALIWVAIYAVLYESSTGRAWTAIGLDSRLAASLGINVYRYRVLAFVVSCFTAATMGAFYAHYQNSLLPGTFDIFKTVYVQVYAILGGIQFPLLGPLIGAIVMVFFPEFMRITREIEPVFTGVLLILLIVFLPTGLLSLPGVRSVAVDPIGILARIGRSFSPSKAPSVTAASKPADETMALETPSGKSDGEEGS